MFGPPMSYWTGRFESKHRVAKSAAHAAKNVINITKTIRDVPIKDMKEEYKCLKKYFSLW